MKIKLLPKKFIALYRLVKVNKKVSVFSFGKQIYIQYIPLSSNPQGKLKNIRDNPKFKLTNKYKWNISKSSSNPKVRVIRVRAKRDAVYLVSLTKFFSHCTHQRHLIGTFRTEIHNRVCCVERYP